MYPFIPKGAQVLNWKEISNFTKKILKCKQHQKKKILLNSLHLNGHTLVFHKQAQKLQTALEESTAQKLIYLNGHTLGLHPQTQKLEPPCTG